VTETILKQVVLPKCATGDRSPSVLRIVTYQGDEGVNLVLLDEELKEINDLYYDSVDLALEDAAQRFGILSEAWEDINISTELPTASPQFRAMTERIRATLRRNAVESRDE